MTAGAWGILLGTWIVAVASPGPDFLAVLRRTLDRGLRAGLRVAVGVSCGIATWLCLALFGIVGLVARNHVVFGIVRIAGALFLIWYGVSIMRALWRARRESRRARAVVAGVEAGEGTGGQTVGGEVPCERQAADDKAAQEQAAEAAPPGAESPVSPDLGTGQEPTANVTGTAQPTAASPVAARPATRWSDWRLGYLTNTVGNPKAVVFFGALFASILPAGITAGESVLAGAIMTAVALANFSILAVLSSRGPVIRAYQRLQPVIDGVLGCLFVVLGLVLIPWTGF